MKQKLLSLFFVLFCVVSHTLAQTKSVSGRIVDSNGEPIPGVTVTASSPESSVQSNSYGDYKIEVAEGATLSFRSLGYEANIVQIGSAAIYNVVLEQSERTLDEVIVTAYGSQTKESIVGSVASVSSKDIEKRPVSSVTAVLEGIAPGIQVNNSYGEPGSSPNIRIRGYTSINGNNSPVIILDGVVFGGNISDINPNDIESMSVLKDATSGALYGNRAAAGAIVITTKKGRSGANFNAVVNQGVFSRGVKEYETLSPQEFMEVSWQGYRNQLLWNSPTLSEADANAQASSTLVPSILKLNIFDRADDQLFDENGRLVSGIGIKGSYAEDLDWFKPIIRNGYRQEYSLSGNGGTEKGNYLYSLGYLDEQAYIVSSEFTRLSGRLSGEITPTTWLTAGMSANATHQLSHFTTGDGNGFINPWNYARNIAPIYPIHLHDLTTGAYVLDTEGNKVYDDGSTSRAQYAGRHIIWETELNKDQTRRNTLNSQAFVDFNILNNLKFSVIGDINLRFSELRAYENAIIGDGSGNGGRGGRDIYNYKNYTLQQQLSYNTSFDGLHNFDILVGHENYGSTYTWLYARKAGEVFPGMEEFANYNNITSLTDYSYDDKSESYLGRLRYNYDEKYYFDGSIRRDGTSRLHPDQRWGTFWSLGGTWMISKENFMQEANWLNELKLRAATGVVGNITSASMYAYMPKYSLGQNNNLPAFWKSSLGNPELLWEGNQSSSVALEGRIFDRLNFMFEYFDKRSKDLIFDLNLPLSTGSTSTSAVSTITKNIGDISNKGIELTLDADIIRKQDWRWNIGVNATFLKNEVVRLPEENREEGIISSPFKYFEGKSIYEYWLPKYAGVDMLTGQALYFADTEANDPTEESGPHYAFQEEINGTMYTRNAAYAVRDFLGTAVPNVMGAFNTNVSYKNFSLSGLFTYSLGGLGLDYSYMSLMSVTANPSNVHKDVLNSWTTAPEGMTETSEKRINRKVLPQINYATSQYNNATSSRFLFDNNYFVIKNIALAYRMPEFIVNKINARSLVLNFAVENLATFTALQGYSPQQTFGGYSQNEFVPARTFSFGLNLGL